MTSRAAPPGSGAAAVDGAAVEHAAVFAGTDAGLCGPVVPRITAGAEGGRRVTVAVGDRVRAALRARLPGHVLARVDFADRAAYYDAPGRTVGALHRLAVEARGAGALFVGEPDPPPVVHTGRGPDRAHLEREQWRRMEAALDQALAGDRLTVLCLHDTSALDAAALRDGREAHPLLLVCAGMRANPAYRAPTGGDGGGTAAPGPPAEPVLSLDIRPDLPSVREEAAGLAEEAGLPAERRADLVVAVNELAANVLEHGAGKGTVSLWREGGRLVCEVMDGSAELDDPLVGFRPADGLGGRGYGLWITRQVCDFLEVLPGPDGTRMRAHFRI
ncbi:anti-sigma factor RsbA family regulatory protein [Nocardiopsis sp. RSe5-2]|uniref:Anti-sigma factor RsbA family regulatory protein n=1 Tax=Nocardiopsis endophytica TaxID=3018445 RepID=A0ABT4UCS4_9ACTN|nr:anti-sigma factor RsbA family regulatory protein [Nocardiopsis endophytica]MDA2814702.1 anti-sigma factor RsbA family regulatory protein [Nocardiopsis endophytica]